MKTANYHGFRLVMVAITIALLMLTVPHSAHGQTPGSPREPIIIQVIQLDYADADQLAAVLSPLLSQHGSIVPYAPTNTLIIRDKKSIVEKLVRIIKGPSDPTSN